ncbi:MAG: hypothetical protein ACF8NJ_01890, partial [Phycisphaerales bacterium JB038]
MPTPPARYTDLPFPPYRYLPGAYPHPTLDPQGHSYEAEPLRIQRWMRVRPRQVAVGRERQVGVARRRSGHDASMVGREIG